MIRAKYLVETGYSRVEVYMRPEAWVWAGEYDYVKPLLHQL